MLNLANHTKILQYLRSSKVNATSKSPYLALIGRHMVATIGGSKLKVSASDKCKAPSNKKRQIKKQKEIKEVKKGQITTTSEKKK
jgi:hypothetical protein